MELIFVKPPFAPNFISQLVHFFFQFKRRQHLHLRGRQDEGRHRCLLPPPAGPARVGARLGEGAEGRRRAERDQLRLRRQPEGAAVGEEGRLSSAFFTLLVFRPLLFLQNKFNHVASAYQQHEFFYQVPSHVAETVG